MLWNHDIIGSPDITAPVGTPVWVEQVNEVMTHRAKDGWEIVCTVPVSQIGAIRETTGLLVRRLVGGQTLSYE